MQRHSIPRLRGVDLLTCGHSGAFVSSEKPEGAAGEGEGEGSLPLCGEGTLCLSASPCARFLAIPLLFSGFRPSLCLPLQETHH